MLGVDFLGVQGSVSRSSDVIAGLMKPVSSFQLLSHRPLRVSPGTGRHLVHPCHVRGDSLGDRPHGRCNPVSFAPGQL